MPEKEWQAVKEFIYPSEPGKEKIAMVEVAEAARKYLPEKRLEQLKTAVAEGTLNAIEHGNKYQADLPVNILLKVSPDELAIRITDFGGGQPIPEQTSPDLERKLAGLETPRGWGLFLIRNMVDEMHVEDTGQQHILELIIYR